MKAFGSFLLFAVMVFAVFNYSLVSASSTACFDVTIDGGNITHIFVASTPEASASDYAITLDGEPVTHLQTDDGPCESIPRDVWFSLQTNQDMAHVCVSVQGGGPVEIEVSGTVNNECIIGSTPLVSIERVE